MGYRVVDPETPAPTPEHPCTRCDVAEAAGLATLAAAVFTMAPGEQLPTTYHYHERREELFYVLAGTLRVETPEGEYDVPADRLFVAEPESPHRAFNPADADGAVRVLMVGSNPFDVARPYDPGTDGTDTPGATGESGGN
jgi:quercetin dioxygenase-like cupin family protein